MEAIHLRRQKRAGRSGLVTAYTPAAITTECMKASLSNESDKAQKEASATGPAKSVRYSRERTLSRQISCPRTREKIRTALLSGAEHKLLFALDPLQLLLQVWGKRAQSQHTHNTPQACPWYSAMHYSSGEKFSSKMAESNRVIQATWRIGRPNTSGKRIVRTSRNASNSSKKRARLMASAFTDESPSARSCLQMTGVA